MDKNGYYEGQGKIQPIDLINDLNLSFNMGNVVKYASRAGKKTGEPMGRDLGKIATYLVYEMKSKGSAEDWREFVVRFENACSEMNSYFQGLNSLLDEADEQ